MEAKLKSQRVADLRELLQKAAVPIPAKANKADLIAKILASPAAIEVFNNIGNSPSSPAAVQKSKAPEPSHVGQDDDLLAPPEEFDWGPSNGVQAPPPVPTASPKAVSNTTTKLSTTVKGSGVQQSTKIPTAPSVSTGTTEYSKDDELEKRKKRAARFGIPLVETKAKGVPKGTKAGKDAPKGQNVSTEEATKIAARAARFGITQISTGVTQVPPAAAANTATTGSPGTKRKRSPAPVDSEEMERRKKRAERFATGKEASAQT